MLRLLVLVSLVACSFGAAPRLRRPRLDGRIVGGEDADINDYPYQLSFEYSGSHMCGASIISAIWVVTAAHCVDGVSPSYAQFRAGSSIRGTGGSIHPAAELIANPDYDYYTIDFDVAVARVSVAFDFGPGVQPIPLTAAEPYAGHNSVVTGWGTLSSGSSSLPTTLQVVVVPIVSREECNEAYIAYGGVTENMICAAVSGGGKDACQGDSGGPLAVDGVLAGLVSWGVGCAEPLYPGVYSNVASLRSFITRETGVN
ncbi:trypsin alpha-like [Zootermopsis nevadensis]|uniref:trypsin alpha-like n=1 Tax=Zootermopsis nevadensis TaxID=136037 RepID=UPI000B8E7017|nr:trypsin alpha-like [Zootermopsis nevadensis]